MKKKKKYSVLGIGIATMDYLLTVPAYPDKDTKIHCSSWVKQGGGNCANTLVGLSRLGIDTSIYTCIGKDPVGTAIKNSLEIENVVTKFILESGMESPRSVVIVGEKDSSRTIIHRSGVDYTHELPFDRDLLNDVDLLYSDGRFSATALKYALEACKRGIPVIVEAERTGLRTEKLFTSADILILSREYHNQVFGKTPLEKSLDLLYKLGVPNVIITLGADGCICLTGGQINKFGASKTIVVDSTGAGDAFNAGIIYGRLLDWKIEKSIEFASWIAAHKCKKPGARMGLPYEHEI